MLPRPYQAYAPMQAAAMPRPQLWRLLAAFVTIAALQIGGLYALSLVATPGLWIEDQLRAYLQWLDVPAEHLTYLPDAARALTLLAVFILAFVNVLIASALWYRRGLTSLMGPWGATLRQAGRATLGLIALGVVLQLLPLTQASERSPGLPPELWQALFPLAVMLLLIQVSAEELLFRGLMQSQLAARFASPFLWIGVPAVLFSLGHADLSLGMASSALVIGYIFLYAISLADITARAGTLGPAIIMHLFNNINVLLLVSPVGPLDGLALYRQDVSLSDASALAAYAPFQIGATLAAWVAVRVALWR